MRVCYSTFGCFQFPSYMRCLHNVRDTFDPAPPSLCHWPHLCGPPPCLESLAAACAFARGTRCGGQLLPRGLARTARRRACREGALDLLSGWRTRGELERLCCRHSMQIRKDADEAHLLLALPTRSGLNNTSLRLHIPGRQCIFGVLMFAPANLSQQDGVPHKREDAQGCTRQKGN